MVLAHLCERLGISICRLPLWRSLLSRGNANVWAEIKKVGCQAMSKPRDRWFISGRPLDLYKLLAGSRMRLHNRSSWPDRRPASHEKASLYPMWSVFFFRLPICPYFKSALF